MKKIIGFTLWLLAFLIPFKYAILNTDDVVMEDGRADNITGLLAFVAMIALIFAGYVLVDSDGKKKAAAEGHGH